MCRGCTWPEEWLARRAPARFLSRMGGSTGSRSSRPCDRLPRLWQHGAGQPVRPPRLPAGAHVAANCHRQSGKIEGAAAKPRAAPAARAHFVIGRLIVPRQFLARPDLAQAEQKHVAMEQAGAKIGLATVVDQLRAASSRSTVKHPAAVHGDCVGAPWRATAMAAGTALVDGSLPGVLDHLLAGGYGLAGIDSITINPRRGNAKPKAGVTRIYGRRERQRGGLRRTHSIPSGLRAVVLRAHSCRHATAAARVAYHSRIFCTAGTVAVVFTEESLLLFFRFFLAIVLHSFRWNAVARRSYLARALYSREPGSACSSGVGRARAKTGRLRLGGPLC